MTYAEALAIIYDPDKYTDDDVTEAIDFVLSSDNATSQDIERAQNLL